jgi:DNA polymerase-1
MAWVSATTGDTEAVLLDPRDPIQLSVVAKVTAEAPELVLHNASFDVPPMVHYGMMRVEDIDKVTDTIVYARMAFPGGLNVNGLDSLATNVLGMPKSGGTMTNSFKAFGYATKDAGWYAMDIDVPIYRYGAMADTVVGLRLVQPLRAACWKQTVEGHNFGALGVDGATAIYLMEREQIVNRIMMRRSAVGLAVDVDYLSRYADQHAGALAVESNKLEVLGLRPGQGSDVVEYLDTRGELPANWPRTKTGKLQADKKAMEQLETMSHPLAVAHRTVATLTRVQGYLEKVAAYVDVTGRLHNQVGVLGASATGRMAYSEPELQQFPADARPIIADDGQGLTSIDWSSIEPVVMANCAGDTAFLSPFENGADLYAPIVEVAQVQRKTAKVVLLASMYGQGKAKTAASLGVSENEAASIKSRVMAAMPPTARYMDQVKAFADRNGKAITISGRVLNIPRDPESGKFRGYKGVNYTCQGSAYDVLAESLVELKRRNLSDHVQLAMHDELVADTQAAPEIQYVMQQPPARLTWWANQRASQRVPILRTDMNDMGNRWAYV